jgi:hypothetical protein
MAELVQFRISGTTLEHLAKSDKGLEYLKALDGSWTWLRDLGVEEIHRELATGSTTIRHRPTKMPWPFRSISDPPPLGEVHPAVLAYVTRSA